MESNTHKTVILLQLVRHIMEYVHATEFDGEIIDKSDKYPAMIFFAL